MDEITQAIHIIADNIVQKNRENIAIVAIYGSYALGTQSSLSDVDMYMIVDEEPTEKISCHLIFQNKPISFWQMDWKSAEKMASGEENFTDIWCNAASLFVNNSLLYSRSKDDLERFNSLKNKVEEATKDTISLPGYIEIENINHDTSIVINNIFFEFDKAELLPQSNEELDRLSTQLAMYPELAIVIEGHTDNMGTFEYNMNLSLERAQAVVNYLKNMGVPHEQISYEGHGYTHPLSENRTERGRQLNRRVAFRLSNIKKPLNNK